MANMKVETEKREAHEETVRSVDASPDILHMDRMPMWRFVLILLSLSTGLFLALMDTSIVSTAILTISNEFGALADTTWLILAYTLTYLGFAVTITLLSDVFGRRDAVIACYVIFIASSIACGFSTSLNMLIAFRAVQGVGGAGVYSLCLVIMPEISPAKLFPVVTSFLGLLVALAGILGPVLGGIISEHNWRWIFWLNGPVSVVAAIIFMLAWPRNAHGFELSKRRLRDIDLVGCILLVAASVLFVFALQEAGLGAYGWSSPVIICTLLFGCLSAVALFAWEVFIWKKHGDQVAMILPARVFKNRILVGGILNTICSGFTLFVCVFYIPLRFQIVNLDDPLRAGIHLLPLLASAALGAMVGGLSSLKKNHIFSTCIVASVLIIIGAALLSTLPWTFPIPASIYGYQIIAGLGTGMTLSAIALMVPLETDFRDHAVTQGIVGQVRILGGSIGVAAASAIFNTQLRENLSGILTSEEITGLQTSYESVTKTLRPDQLLAIRDVYASSFSASLRLCSYIAVVGLLSACLIWQRYPPSVAARKAEITLAMEELHRRTAAQMADQ